MVEYRIAEGYNSFAAEGLGIKIDADTTYSTDDESDQRFLDAQVAVERVPVKAAKAAKGGDADVERFDDEAAKAVD